MSSTFAMPSFSMKTLFKNSNLPSYVQSHLVSVYATISTMALVAALGAYMHVYDLFLFGGGFLSFIFGAISLGILQFTAYTQSVSKNIRYALLYAFAFFQGLSLGPLIEYSLHISPSGSTLLSTFVFTALIFASFSISAIFSNRRSLIYLLGICGAASSVLFWSSIINFLPFFRSNAVFTVELYAGLLVFCGYIIADTQMIIEQALYIKNPDVITSATKLFVDLVAIFVRILLILIRSQEKKQQEDDRRRRQRRS